LGGLVLVISTHLGRAQWASQTNVLAPGWNAVYLEVQPEPEDADTVFAGLPVESVWAWNRRAGQPQFVQDVNTLVPKQPEWLTFFPAGHTNRTLQSLFDIQGGRPLLIKLGGASSVTWVVTGKPVLPKGDWIPDAQNLVGFHVSDTTPPTFANYLRSSAAHAGKQILALNAAGKWSVIVDTTTTTIQRGKAYWVQTVGASSFMGPLYVEPDLNAGLDFGTFAEERRILLRNDGTNVTRTFTIRSLPSLARPGNATNSALNAGTVVLSYWNFAVTNATNVTVSWKPFDAPMNLSLPAGGQATLRLAVRRRDFALSGFPAAANAAYQSVLEVTDGAGSRVLVPVAAQKASAGVGLRGSKDSSVSIRAGLWVGVVSMTNVSWVGAPSINIIQANPAFDFGDRTKVRPTASEFQFRILLHVDGGGAVRLLQRVMEVWTNGTWVADAQNPGLKLPGTPGSFRLFTDEKVAAQYMGAALRDGQPVARRLSTPIYAIREPVLMAQAGEFGVGTISCALTNGYDDALNPFKHQYHPDHDNYKPGYRDKFPAGVESYDILRAVRLEFSSTNMFGATAAGWLDNQLGGFYYETVTGIHREPIHVKGTFLLRRVSTVSTLN
jgi:hypothetical protein